MNVAVIFGGESCEHDISIITGQQLIANMDEYLYNIIPIYINKSGDWLTDKRLLDFDNFEKFSCCCRKCMFIPNDSFLYINNGNKYKKFKKIDVAIVCLHGINGEDGSVASVLQLSKIPYSCSSLYGCSLCLDKCIFKIFAKGLGVSVVEGVEFSENCCSMDVISNVVTNLGLPVIIKPSRLGSSIGIDVCNTEDELEVKLKKALKYDKKILIEKFIDIKKEVNIAILRNKNNIIFSNTEEPVFYNKILSFEDKYINGANGFDSIKRITPADISQQQLETIKDISERVYLSLDMSGVVRFDFLIDKEDNVYLNEVNVIPGSMAYYLFDKNKFDYSKIIDILIKSAVFKNDSENNVIKYVESNVLKEDLNGFKK